MTDPAEVNQLLIGLRKRLARGQEDLKEFSGHSSLHLDVCTDAVIAVADFLNCVPMFRDVTDAFDILIAALKDVSDGKRPDMFATRGSRGRKTSTAAWLLKIRTVFCIELLKANGLSARDARQFVVDEWKSLGIRQFDGENVSVIKGTTIEGWELWLRGVAADSREHRIRQDFMKGIAKDVAKGSLDPEQAKAAVRNHGRKLAVWGTANDKKAAR